MEKGRNKKGKKFHPVPFFVGLYGAVLGLGLTVIGAFGSSEGVGTVRIVLGLGMALFGLYGVWDGVRDVIRPGKKAAGAGNAMAGPCRSETVSQPSGAALTYGEAADRNLSGAGEEEGRRNEVESLQSKENGQQGEAADGNLSGAEEDEILQDGEDISLEEAISDWQNLLNEQNGSLSNWNQLLVIFGENWRDEHKFFSARDLELAVEGVYREKYIKVILVWGYNVFEIFPGVQDELFAVWHIYENQNSIRHFVRNGTVTQMKFWLINGLDTGNYGDSSGWVDITGPVEKGKK